MTKSNALYWRYMSTWAAGDYIRRNYEAETTIAEENGSFEVVDGDERYLVEVRVFDLGGD